jgi:hypothetical protein
MHSALACQFEITAGAGMVDWCSSIAGHDCQMTVDCLAQSDRSAINRHKG